MEQDNKLHATKGGDEAAGKKKPAKAGAAQADVTQPAIGSSTAKPQKESPAPSKARGDAKPSPDQKAPAKITNRLRELRIERMMSKAELARKAGLSVLTVARIEKGYGCRMDTKRKILKALGLKLSDRRKVFEDE